MELIEWMENNATWIFSGIGVTIFGFLFKKLKNDNPTTSASSINNITISNSNTVSGKDSDLIEEKDSNLDFLKNHIRILFIDDDTKFKVVKILHNAGWIHTKLVRDIKSYDDPSVKEAHIIFVDVHGVGKQVDSRDEGLGLSMHLKQKYPEKKIIIYSAETTGNRFHQALRVTDDSLQKNADSFEFQNIVEKFSKEVYEKV